MMTKFANKLHLLYDVITVIEPEIFLKMEVVRKKTVESNGFRYFYFFF